MRHLHLKKGPPPPEYIRFVLYSRFHWSHEDIRTTPLSEILTQLKVMGFSDNYTRTFKR